MATQVIKADLGGGSTDGVDAAVDVLRRGGLVAFPTETVYGLAADASQSAAVDRLRKVKGRSPDQAFTLHIASREDAGGFAPGISGLARRLMRKAWPGPLTLITEVADPASAPALDGLDKTTVGAIYYKNSVGMRCPDNPVAHAVLTRVETPIVAASANAAGERAPLTAQEVAEALGDGVDLVLDGGRTRYGKASTIVRVTGGSYELVREGVFDAGSVARMARLRLLFVCTGNTCRSPMAEILAKGHLAEQMGCSLADLEGLGIHVSSAGVAGGHGHASDGAVGAMKRRELDLTDHYSKPLTAELVEQADFVYALTAAHRDAIVALAPSASERVMLLHGDQDIIDPIGGDDASYERCAETVEAGVRAQLKEVLS